MIKTTITTTMTMMTTITMMMTMTTTMTITMTTTMTTTMTMTMEPEPEFAWSWSRKFQKWAAPATLHIMSSFLTCKIGTRHKRYWKASIKGRHKVIQSQSQNNHGIKRR